MDTFLGLVGVALFILCVILFAAAVTWAVVRLTPKAQPKNEPPAS